MTLPLLVMGSAQALQAQSLTASLAHEALWVLVLVFHPSQQREPHLENHEAVHLSKTVQGIHVVGLPKNPP